MKIVKTIKEMQETSKSLKKAGKSIGFVPTMGYLHEGHMTLVRRAKESCDAVVVSIFVNPLQFGPKEDLSRYPRDMDRDTNMLEAEGTDIIFFPDAESMYPEGYQTYVDVENITKTLCGAARQGHFRGVTTVVAKLFNAVMANKAFFGEKDYQQLAVIRRMTKDLNIDIEIIGAPIVREPDGLAMSSRNTYLSPDERRSALCLYKALLEAEKMVSGGNLDAQQILGLAELTISSTPHTRIDYIRLCHPDTLEYVEKGRIPVKTLLALAVFVGKTRLIDNILLEVR